MKTERALPLAAIPLFTGGLLVADACGDSAGGRWLAVALMESGCGLLIINGVSMLRQTLRDLKEYRR